MSFGPSETTKLLAPEQLKFLESKGIDPTGNSQTNTIADGMKSFVGDLAAIGGIVSGFPMQHDFSKVELKLGENKAHLHARLAAEMRSRHTSAQERDKFQTILTALKASNSTRSLTT